MISNYSPIKGFVVKRTFKVKVKEDLAIFCTEGVIPAPQLFWASSSLHLSLSGGKFRSYQGPNASAVTEMHKAAGVSINSKNGVFYKS